MSRPRLQPFDENKYTLVASFNPEGYFSHGDPGFKGEGNPFEGFEKTITKMFKYNDAQKQEAQKNATSKSLIARLNIFKNVF